LLEVPPYDVADSVTIRAGASALIIVDMQNDFVDSRGTLCVPGARGTIPAIRRLIDLARAHKIPVIYTQDWHAPDDPEFGVWGRHAVGGSWGAEIVPELSPAPEDIVVRKLRYDGFFGTTLEQELHSRSVQMVMITGTVSNICVLHTAGSAALRGIHVIVPVDAVSAITEFDQHAAFRQVAFLYRGALTRSEAIRASQA
jgi:nicotinamidase-related amidase